MSATERRRDGRRPHPAGDPVGRARRSSRSSWSRPSSSSSFPRAPASSSHGRSSRRCRRSCSRRPMSAASGSSSGVASATRWHHVRRGFPAVVVFAGALLIATLLHLDRFSANLSFAVWLALYATTPFVIAALADRAAPARSRDPRSSGCRHPPRRRASDSPLIGAGAFAAGAAVFLAPAGRGILLGVGAHPAHRSGDRSRAEPHRRRQRGAAVGLRAGARSASSSRRSC